MNVLIAGDIHGDYHHILRLLEVARNHDCNIILALGDFGYFPNRKWSIEFLTLTNNACQKSGMNIYWLDGNHENHADIFQMTQGANDQSFLTVMNETILSNLHYLPRGYVFDIDDVSFMSYGGAYSIDRSMRVKNISWFPEEMIDIEHLRSLPDQHVDILLTHDVPYGFDFGYDETLQESITSTEIRLHLWELVQKTTPYMCFGGHHHIRRFYPVEHAKGVTHCHIMSANLFGADSWTVLELEKFKQMFIK